MGEKRNGVWRFTEGDVCRCSMRVGGTSAVGISVTIRVSFTIVGRDDERSLVKVGNGKGIEHAYPIEIEGDTELFRPEGLAAVLAHGEIVQKEIVQEKTEMEMKMEEGRRRFNGGNNR